MPRRFYPHRKDQSSTKQKPPTEIFLRDQKIKLVYRTKHFITAGGGTKVEFRWRDPYLGRIQKINFQQALQSFLRSVSVPQESLRKGDFVNSKAAWENIKQNSWHKSRALMAGKDIKLNEELVLDSRVAPHLGKIQEYLNSIEPGLPKKKFTRRQRTALESIVLLLKNLGRPRK